jgi:beta-glucosidase-like glycosyl hydrolase
MQFGATAAPTANGTRRMLASLKHFTAYSRETDRMGSQGNVSVFDLWDTYLPQYQRAMVDSFSAGTMCS